MILVLLVVCTCVIFFFSSRRRHTRCALVTGVQTCALPISAALISQRPSPQPIIQERNAAIECRKVMIQVEFLRCTWSAGATRHSQGALVRRRCRSFGFAAGGESSMMTNCS